MSNSSRREWLAMCAGAAVSTGFSWAAASDELSALTLKAASGRIRAKSVSPVELTMACLDRIKTYNPKIGAWITVMGEKALEQAKILEKEQMAGNFRSPLHGIPIGLKDSIDTGGVRTTAASAVYEYRFPDEDAEVVRRLKAAGAVVAGKCNMHEFDAGATSAVSYWGPVRNPWNVERVTGGSSGGPAAAVAADNCFAALGTDASGGIRTAAAYCGVTGLKPTYGRVSLRGIVPYAWSLDHCGPIARTVEDTAMMLQEIAGYDRADIDSVDKPVPNYSAAIGASAASFRLGIPAQFFDHLDDEVARAVEDAMAVLNKLTRGSREAGLPSLLRAGATAETATYHEGLRGVNGGGFEPSTAREFPAAQDSTKAADYIRGWRELQLVRRTASEEIFRKQNIDLLIMPTARHGAPTVEEALVPSAGGGRGGGGRGGGTAAGSASAGAGADAGGSSRGVSDLEANTRLLNGYGLPAITIPCGFAKDGMPIGLQICGPHFNEAAVLSLAYAYQQATDWHNRRPSLTPDTKVPALSKAASEQTGG